MLITGLTAHYRMNGRFTCTSGESKLECTGTPFWNSVKTEESVPGPIIVSFRSRIVVPEPRWWNYKVCVCAIMFYAMATHVQSPGPARCYKYKWDSWRYPEQNWRKRLKIVWCCGILSTAIYVRRKMKVEEKEDSFSKRQKCFVCLSTVIEYHRKRHQHTSTDSVDNPVMSGDIVQAGHAAGGSTISKRTIVTAADLWKDAIRCGHRGAMLLPKLATHWQWQCECMRWMNALRLVINLQISA